MKDVNKNIEREVNQILDSTSVKERVSTSPFFTTRIIGKVEQLEDSSVFFTRLSVALKPVLVLLVIFNVFNFYVYNSSNEVDAEQSDGSEIALNYYSAWDNEFILSDEIIGNE